MTSVVSGRSAEQIPPWTYAPLAIALVFRLSSEATTNLSYLILALYALFGNIYAIRALAFSWLFTMLNPGIVPDSPPFAAARHAVLLAAVFGILINNCILRPSGKLDRGTFWTLLIGAFLIVHSIIISPIRDVSILKALSWALVMASLLSGWAGLSPIKRQRAENELFFFLALIAFVSMPLAVLPVGYLTNGRGFQGILNQPQAFGVFAALLGAWATSKILSQKKPSWLLFGVTALSLGLVLMSQTRTAGFAFALSIVLSLLLASLLTGRSIQRVAPGLISRRTLMSMCLVAIGGLAFAPTILTTMESYVVKSNSTDINGIGDAYMRSRGILILPMLDNISKRPLTGIGFGIASDPQEMTISRDPLLGLPTGAAVEKGVAPLMILEELGIIGFLLMLLWLLTIIYRSACSGLENLTVALTILLLNLGEASLFSPGGMGLLTIILLSWAGSLGRNNY